MLAVGAAATFLTRPRTLHRPHLTGNRSASLAAARHKIRHAPTHHTSLARSTTLICAVWVCASASAPTSLSASNKMLAVPDPEHGGMPKIRLTHGTDTADVFMHGAHVTSWVAGGEEQLFLSRKAIFDGKKAIRGGVPICWPQFSDLGPLTQAHGFARNSTWEIDPEAADVGPGAAQLRLLPTPEHLAVFPFPFKLTMRCELHDSKLTQSLTVVNTGVEEMQFTTALHTYYVVPDLKDATVLGLKGVEYLDSLQGRASIIEEADAVPFPAEVDRIYVMAPDGLILNRGHGRRQIQVDRESFADAVVWNPYVVKSSKFADMAADEYQHFVCIEAARCAGQVTLKPGAVWRGVQTLTLLPAA